MTKSGWDKSSAGHVAGSKLYCESAFGSDLRLGMRRASTCSRLSFRAVAIAIVFGGIVNLPAIAIAFSGSDGAAVSGPPVISSRLGVLLADATGTSGAEREGAVVRVVIPGGGAEKAGLLAGDLLVECDDEPVQNVRDVIRLLQGTPHSGAVRLLNFT
jgi:S1-C subfamily serine protease